MPPILSTRPTPRTHARRPGRRAAALAAGAGALLLAACSEAASIPEALSEVHDPQSAVVEAAEASAALDALELQVSFELDSPIGSGRVEAEGTVDQALRGRIVQRGGIGREHVEIEILGDGDRLWLRPGGDLAAVMPDGATWVSTSVADLEQLGVEDAFGLDLDLMLVLRGASAVEPTGTGAIGGDAVRLFRADLDLQAARDASSPQEADAIAASIRVDDEGTMVAEEIAVDAEGRLRRLVIDVQSGTPDDPLFGRGIGLRVVLEILDPAPDIEVPDAPAASDTVELAEVPELVSRIRS